MIGGNGDDYGARMMATSGGAPPSYTTDSEGEGLSLRDYLGVIWRRKWVILIVVVVATATAYYVSARQTPMYQADATLIYETQINIANSLYGDTYTDINDINLQINSVGSVIASPDMRDRAGERLESAGLANDGFSLSAEVASESTGSSSTTSNVVLISAVSDDARLAAKAANAYAGAFVDYRREAVKDKYQEAIDVIQKKLDAYPEGAKDGAEYLTLKNYLESLEVSEATATGNFRILIPASTPAAPFAPQPVRNALLGLAVGLFAGVGLAFVLEQFDTRLRKPDQVAQILQQPILGRIPRISKRLLTESGLVTMKHPDGHVAEAFRMVRTNLDFMAVDSEVRSLLVTSCMKGEGKSVTVANLAITMALAGKKVIVVDGDLRRPRIHTLFDLHNDSGVSTVATGRDRLHAALQPVEVEPLKRGAAKEDFDSWAAGADAMSRLYVLTSGPIPPNPGEIVASRRFDAILEKLTKEADLVLVDSPAMLAVGDTSAIAAKVDGLVFFIDMQVVKRPQLMTAADQLRRLPVKMLGTVVRMAGTRGSRYYYYSPYPYYGYTFTEDGRRIKERRRPGRKPAASQPAKAPKGVPPQV